MKEHKFECEVLTPLFLGGASTRVNPELRAPSVRGVLRYWYRTIIGGFTLLLREDDEELAALKREEERVFGTTERASAVAVIVASGKKPQVATFEKDRAIRTANGDVLPTGKDYLLWSMAASGRPGTPRYQPNREYIKPGTKFDVVLRAQAGGGELDKARAAFWLFSNLGALGARASRGAGSVEALPRDAQEIAPVFKVCQSPDELKSYLSQGLRRCLAVVSGGSTTWRRFDGRLTPYDILSPDSAEIWVVTNTASGWNSSTEALNGIGERLRDYRSHRSPLGRADHDAVLKWMEKGSLAPEIKRAAFGLPVPFRYSEGGPSDVIQPEGSDRRASPLRIRVARLTTGRYVGVLTLFKSRFLDEGKRLELRTRKWKAQTPADYRVIQEFIQTFEVKWRVAL
jgi:CRISPR-associated protein Cmr1